MKRLKNKILNRIYNNFTENLMFDEKTENEKNYHYDTFKFKLLKYFIFPLGLSVVISAIFFGFNAILQNKSTMFLMFAGIPMSILISLFVNFLIKLTPDYIKNAENETYKFRYDESPLSKEDFKIVINSFSNEIIDSVVKNSINQNGITYNDLILLDELLLDEEKTIQNIRKYKLMEIISLIEYEDSIEKLGQKSTKEIVDLLNNVGIKVKDSEELIQKEENIKKIIGKKEIIAKEEILER